MPHKNSVSLNWRLQKDRYMLLGNKCSCGSVYFPAARRCACGGQLSPTTLSGKGVVESFTVIHAAPDGFESQLPYVVGIVRLSEGPKITAQIVQPTQKIKIGSRVRGVFRKTYSHGDSQLLYGTKFILDE